MVITTISSKLNAFATTNDKIIIMNQLVFAIVLALYCQFTSEGKQEKRAPSLIPPKHKAEVFMDNIISKKGSAQMCAALLDNGQKFFFNELKEGNWAIHYSEWIGGNWSTPQPINFTSPNQTDRDFTFSPNQNYIYFGTDRNGQNKQGLDIYVSKRVSEYEWSPPESICPEINTPANENYPCCVENGSIYFFSNRKEGLGGSDIYVSELKNGTYQTPVLLPKSINSVKNDWDAFVSPDESYIIFSSQNRKDTHGGQDLYISFKSENGNWQKSVNMGSEINSFSSEICPVVSADGKIFFFTSRKRGKADIYWIDAGFIKKLAGEIF